jgi:hypothetical protein
MVTVSTLDLQQHPSIILQSVNIAIFTIKALFTTIACLSNATSLRPVTSTRYKARAFMFPKVRLYLYCPSSETPPADEFERTVEQFIEKATAWDGALPAETFFAAWKELTEDAPSLEVQATLIDDELVLETAAESPLTAHGNRIRLEDGRELVIRFRAAPSITRQ